MGLNFNYDKEMTAAAVDKLLENEKVGSDINIELLNEFFKRSENGEFPERDNFSDKVKIAVILNQQTDDKGKIKYVFKNNVGIELALRGNAEGRNQHDNDFDLKENPRLEIYDCSKTDDVKNGFFQIFNGSAGITRINEKIDDSVCDTIEYGGKVFIIPKIEILVIKEYLSENQSRKKKAHLLMQKYDLDLETYFEYEKNEGMENYKKNLDEKYKIFDGKFDKGKIEKTKAILIKAERKIYDRILKEMITEYNEMKDEKFKEKYDDGIFEQENITPKNITELENDNYTQSEWEFPDGMIFYDNFTISPVQMEILKRQWDLIKEFKNIDIKNNDVLLDDKGKLVFKEGTLLHGIGHFDEEKLNAIAESGILAGEFFGVLEDGETYYCADFWRIDRLQTVNEFIDGPCGKSFLQFGPGKPTLPPDASEDLKARYKSSNVAFIINPNKEIDKFLSMDAYAEENDNNPEIREFLNEDAVKDELGKNRGLLTAIVGGIPANAISGIMIGSKVKDEQIEFIKKTFPNCYIINSENTWIYNPNEQKDRENTNVSNMQSLENNIDEKKDQEVKITSRDIAEADKEKALTSTELSGIKSLINKIKSFFLKKGKVEKNR